MREYRIKLDKYGIDKYEYLELRAFCLQYPQKRKRLHLLSGAALEKAKSDIELIEQTAKEVDEFLSKYLIKSVTENISVNRLIVVYSMPESRDSFNKKRRQFYYLLAKYKNML